MSGLRKAKKYDWKDSNMALFGSDVEKGVKKEAAQHEKAWHGCGQSPGLKVWRINKFQVEPWPERDYGNFYTGDSYIILNTYREKDSDKLCYDVHFWIGKYSTQDEYGTAAYKTVELDTFLDDEPVQHREVQGHESNLFKSYFKSIVLMEGGADTGFNQVKPEEYVPRLLKFEKKGKEVKMEERPRKRSSLNDSDVFILDCGLKLIQWHGKNCNYMEKYAAAQEIAKLKDIRSNKGTVEIRKYEQDELADDHHFYDLLDAGDDDDDDDDDDGDEEQGPDLEGKFEAIKVSDDDGTIGMERMPNEGFKLNPNDVFILLCKSQLYVWIGKRASDVEKKNAIPYGHNFLKTKNCPYISMSVIKQGREPPYFSQDIPIAA